MIVVGVDVHKHSLMAVAVDGAGRVLEERRVVCGEPSLLAWAGGLGSERLWALEDCRHVTGALGRMLLAAGEELVRVPPKLTGSRDAPVGSAASLIRSMLSRSPGWRCVSLICHGRVRARSATGS